jgi:hypothetical protein
VRHHGHFNYWPKCYIESLPHELSDGSELFSVTLGEREKGLVVLQLPFPRMTTAATTAWGATPAPPGLCYACTTRIATAVCMSALQPHRHTQCHLPASSPSAVGHRDNSLWPVHRIERKQERKQERKPRTERKHSDSYKIQVIANCRTP